MKDAEEHFCCLLFQLVADQEKLQQLLSVQELLEDDEDDEAFSVSSQNECLKFRLLSLFLPYLEFEISIIVTFSAMFGI